ncbi:uncharacterized protein PgNI_04837, partial [Pyricularia grisea]|uniref:Uncharacterized protein n=1 Tax=Pyricularia grisea TaxID=148305 RepID=A0A6P8B9M7_PYRGI
SKRDLADVSTVTLLSLRWLAPLLRDGQKRNALAASGRNLTQNINCSSCHARHVPEALSSLCNAASMWLFTNLRWPSSASPDPALPRDQFAPTTLQLL